MSFISIIGKVADIRKNDKRETVVVIVTTDNGKDLKSIDIVVSDNLEEEFLKHKEKYIDRVVEVFGSVSFADHRYEAYCFSFLGEKRRA